MYPVALIGSDISARIAAAALRLAGFEHITHSRGVSTVGNNPGGSVPALTLSANISRVLAATGQLDEVVAAANLPNREQVRLARSAYLISELPLGQFTTDRYRAPLLNIEAHTLRALLGDDPDNDESLTQLEREHNLVIQAEPALPWCPEGYHILWHRGEPASANANITWLGKGCVAWQYTTPTHQHTVFCLPQTQTLDPTHWHPSLAQAVQGAQALPGVHEADVREHFYEGNVAYIGAACYPGSWFYREMFASGAEDAWVLSRMLENYEDDIADGLREYERYRRPRLRKVVRFSHMRAASYLQKQSYQRLLRNVNLAFSSRFMPEIAMQRIDWLYNYDCIRGFR
ncbi:MAG: hypothetical protein AAF513_18845 [Pseudomonadota bacterium]